MSTCLPNPIQLSLPFDGKVCTQCCGWKPFAQYYRHSSSGHKDGYETMCKLCSNRRKREFREANRDKHNADTRRWRAKHPEVKKASNRRYEMAHREVAAARGRRHAALKRENGGSFNPQEWLDLCAKYDHCCLCCGRREPEIKLSVDHVIPLSLGGRNEIANIQPLCHSCNSSKRAKHIDYRKDREDAA